MPDTQDASAVATDESNQNTQAQAQSQFVGPPAPVETRGSNPAIDIDYSQLSGRDIRKLQESVHKFAGEYGSLYLQPSTSPKHLFERGLIDKDGNTTERAALANTLVNAGFLTPSLQWTKNGELFSRSTNDYFDTNNDDAFNSPKTSEDYQRMVDWKKAKDLGLFSSDAEDAAKKEGILSKAGDIVSGAVDTVSNYNKAFYTGGSQGRLGILAGYGQAIATAPLAGVLKLNSALQHSAAAIGEKLGIVSKEDGDYATLKADFRAASYQNLIGKTNVAATVLAANGFLQASEALKSTIDNNKVAAKGSAAANEAVSLVLDPTNIAVAAGAEVLGAAVAAGAPIMDAVFNAKRIAQVAEAAQASAAAMVKESEATNHAFNHLAATGDAADSIAAQTERAAKAQELHTAANSYGRVDSALSRELRTSADAAASEAASHGAMAAESTARAAESARLAEAAANEAKQLQEQSFSLENSLPPTIQSQVANLGRVPAAYASKTAGMAANAVGSTLGVLDKGYSALGRIKPLLRIFSVYTGNVVPAAAIELTLASKNLWKGAGRLLDSVGENMLKEQGTIPFWRNVAADMSSPVGKTFAGYMDNALPPFHAGAKRLASGLAGAAVPSLMYEAINNGGVDSNVLKQAAADSLVFGGAHGAFKGAKIGDQSEFIATRTADRLIFNNNLKNSGDSGQFNLYDRGIQPSTKDMLASYSGAYPNTKFTFTESGPSFAHSNNITLNVNNPRSFADAIAGHEIAHVLQNVHQIQPQIISSMLGDIHLDNPTRLGELNRNGGVLDPEFVQFSNEYNNRLASINKPPLGLDDLSVEFFTDKAAEVLKSDIRTGELTRRAKESRLSRNVKARFSAFFNTNPIAKQLHIKTGGAIDNAGRLVMGSGLLNEGFTQSAGVQAMVRKMYRESAGLARNNTKEVKFNKPGGNKEGSNAGDNKPIGNNEVSNAGDNKPPVISEDGYTMRNPKESLSQRPGVTNGLKGINEYNNLQKKSGIPTPENNLNPSVNKMTGIPDAGQAAAIIQSGAIHPNMIGDFAKLVGLMDATSDGTMVLHYTPLEQGRTTQDSAGETFHHFKPIGVQVTSKGRVLIAGLDIALWNDNIKRIASTHTARKLGYRESALRTDAYEASKLHANSKATDAYFENKYGDTASEHKDLANATYGLLTGAQSIVNRSLATIGIEKVHGVYRTFSLDNILHVTDQTGVDLRLSPNSYYSIKANLMPEAPVIDQFGNNVPIEKPSRNMSIPYGEAIPRRLQ